MLNPSATLPIFVISPCKSANLDANSGTAFVPSAMSFSSSFGLEIILATSSAGRPVSFVSSAVASERTLDTVSGWSERASLKCSRGPTRSFVLLSSALRPLMRSLTASRCKSTPSTKPFALATFSACLLYFVRLGLTSWTAASKKSAIRPFSTTFSLALATEVKAALYFLPMVFVILFPSSMRFAISFVTFTALSPALAKETSAFLALSAAVPAFLRATLLGSHTLVTSANASFAP